MIVVSFCLVTVSFSPKSHQMLLNSSRAHGSQFDLNNSKYLGISLGPKNSCSLVTDSPTQSHLSDAKKTIRTPANYIAFTTKKWRKHVLNHLNDCMLHLTCVFVKRLNSFYYRFLIICTVCAIIWCRYVKNLQSGMSCGVQIFI